MSSEAPVKSFYLNVTTRPLICKKKVQRLCLKKFETSPGDFNENIKPLQFLSLESNALSKEINLCKKNINEIPKKIFFENSYKSLKRKSISEKNVVETDLQCLDNQPSSDKPEKKEIITNTNFNIPATLTVKCDSKPKYIFSENTLSSLKKKSLFDKSTIESEFLCSKDNLHCSVPQNVNRILLNPHLCIETVTFKTLSFKYSDVLVHDSNHKLEQHSSSEKVGHVKKSSLKQNIDFSEKPSPSNSAQVLSKCASFLNISLAESFTEAKHAAKIDLQEHTGNLFRTDLMPAKCSSIGSEWIHSLGQILESHSQNEGKKKIQNLLSGGYCEQILKFQRRKSSERAICEYRNELKIEAESVLVRINSITYDYEIIMTECCLFDPEKLIKGVLCSSLTCIVLFQKCSFNKQLQMKTGKYFILSRSCHLIQLKSFPVIIGKYFESVSPEQIWQNFSRNERLRNNAMKFPESEINCEKINLFKSEQNGDMFIMRKTRLNMCARIQRTWSHRVSLKKLMLKDQYISRLTLLLQTRNGNFYLLNISSHHYLFIDWFKFIQSNNKGNCYFFESLNISHRLEQNRYPKLFQYLKNSLKENKVKQDFVYQLGIDGMTKIPSNIIETGFPPLISLNFQSLILGIKNPEGRVSCKAKVLLQYCSILYVSDTSIFHSGKFVKVFLPQPTASFFKSEVCITEALVSQGNLYLDEYSEISCVPLSNDDISIHDVELSLRPDLNVTDIVSVKGNITDVDENNACIWLQCNFCGNENLSQNSDEIIFCEECCRVIDRPFLKLKMNVSVVHESLQNILLKIELFSLTIKRILSLKENSYQPQCNVSDVLGKEIGPLLCYVKGVDTSNSHTTIFYLNEVEDYH